MIDYAYESFVNGIAMELFGLSKKKKKLRLKRKRLKKRKLIKQINGFLITRIGKRC